MGVKARGEEEMGGKAAAGRPARCRDWSGGRDHLKWLQLRKLQSEEREQRRAGRHGAAPPQQLITGRAVRQQLGAPHALRPQSKPEAEPGPELWPLPLAILGCGGNTESAASSRHDGEKERERKSDRERERPWQRSGSAPPTHLCESSTSSQQTS